LIIDGAGWHTARRLGVSDTITLLKRPPYAPQLNPMENVRAYLRVNKRAITVFDTYEDILDTCQTAWNFLANDANRIKSITQEQWAKRDGLGFSVSSQPV
jgi:transposase